jgi:hypothetical protein
VPRWATRPGEEEIIRLIHTLRKFVHRFYDRAYSRKESHVGQHAHPSIALEPAAADLPSYFPSDFCAVLVG